MKKITFLTLLFGVVQINAQVLSQNFDTALTWTSARLSGSGTIVQWSRVTSGTNPTCTPFQGAGMAKFPSYDVAAGSVYALTSPSFVLDGTKAYKIKFNMYRDPGYASDADNIAVHLTTAATTAPSAGTLLGTVHRSTALAPVVASPGWYEYQFFIPAGTAGTRFIRLVGTSQYGNNTFVDNVSVIENTSTNDLNMQTVDLQTVFLTGTPRTITGSFKNYGANTITSAVINWQVDGGTIYSQNLTGLNITAGGSYNYSHSTTWNPAPGLYSLKVWVSNPNGVADSAPIDNEITRSISVASNSTTNRPLYEKFTSSTCGPCASYNTNTFNPFYSTNSSNLCLINYQVNWPGTGDPYYTAETGVRRGFYNVNAAPTLFVGGIEPTFALATEQTNALAKSAFFSVSSTKNLVGNVMDVNVSITPYLTGTYTVHAVVIEKTTTGNVATNGETSFKNVMMKMIPDANGTVVNFVHDTPVTLNLSSDLSGTFKEADFASDHEVVVFVQNTTTKEIMQAGYAAQQLSSESFIANKIKVYPNPSNGEIKLDTAIPTNVVVVDLTGKVVFNALNITNEKLLDLSSLQKGVYMLKMSNDEGEQIEKVILK